MAMSRYDKFVAIKGYRIELFLYPHLQSTLLYRDAGAYFEWGADDELQKFCKPRPIIQWETPCLNIDIHAVLVENGG